MSSRLTFIESNHNYWLADESGKRRRVPSVSSLKKTLHVFDNDRWKTGQVADAAVDNWEEIASLPPTGRRDAIADAGMRRLAEAAEFGKAVHHYCEQLWHGQPVEVPDDYIGHVRAAADWWESNAMTVIAAEALCWADADDFGAGPMAGRFDLLVRHPALGRGLLDLKTWRGQSTGQPRPEEWAFQLAAYSQMEWIVTGDAEPEDEPFPSVQWLGVLHVGPGGARLYRVTGPGWKAANDQVDLARALKALPKPKMEEVA